MPWELVPLMHRANLAHRLLLYRWWAKHGFYILKWLKKIKIRILFHDKDFRPGPVVTTLPSSVLECRFHPWVGR